MNQTTATRLQEAERGLHEADAELSAGRVRRAAKLFAEASSALFDRRLHFDGLRSPLADHPDDFADLVEGSAVMRQLRAPGGRRSSPGSASVNGRRVLLATWGNANFLGDLRAGLQDSPRVESRFLDLKTLEPLREFAKVGRIARQILAGRDELSGLLEDLLRPHLDWADVVFVDWLTIAPAFLTRIDPGDARIVVRLHSYEAFTVWPHLVDYSRVDDLVFVSNHLRDLTTAVVPALRASDTAPRMHVLPLALQLDRFALPKLAPGGDLAPRFTLALLGWSSVAKDPRWALKVIEALREHDHRYRLVLIGGPLKASTSEAAADYAARLLPELERLRAAGAVELRDHTDDVPSALQDVGVILSSSVREGCHTAVMEGAASAAVPVVRDWPFFAGRPNGARTLFPPDWVVGSTEEAAARVLEVTGDESRWRAAGRDAQDHAMREWDWSVVRPRYDDLLLT